MRALILVDIQNDFLPGGSLAVPSGDEVIPIANRAAQDFDLVVATQDWHPSQHGSFAANHAGKLPGDEIELAGLRQILWPIHCVQNTPGADFAAGLDQSRWTKVFRKGTDPAVDSYSGFFDNGRRHGTGLAEFLRQRDVSDVFVMGLATDYCVKYTALDAAGLGFRTHLLLAGCRGVNLRAGDVQRAIDEMQAAGVELIHTP